jgi:glutamate formiminotransferase
MQSIEAVPNISEGRKPSVIRKLTDIISHHTSVKLLHVDSNTDANRTVFTFAGTPQGVCNACFDLIKASAQLIDMRTQHGAHPRLGATDVCPLIPLQNISLQETALYARQLAARTAGELQIPVYLYEANAATPERKNLSFIRKGEYESLPQKLQILPADFGPCAYNEHVAKTGATVIGARNFLIAFNFSLNTQDVSVAKQIAHRLRERDGGLPGIKAIGWYMPAYHCAQVSCNVTDFHKTSLALLAETCQQEASRMGFTVTAGELIGLLPQEALLQAGRFYLPQEEDTNRLLETAVRKLQLDKIRPFLPNERILENVLKF